jgi:polysaccharide biosynthesis PFTS motif protein
MNNTNKRFNWHLIQLTVKNCLELRNILKYFKLVKNLKNFNSFAVIYKLTDYQRQDLIGVIRDSQFSANFPIYDIRYKKNIVIATNEFSANSVNGVQIICVPSPIIFLFAIQIYKHKFKGSVLTIVTLSHNLKLRLVDKIVEVIYRPYSDVDVFTTITGVKKYPLEFYLNKEQRKFTTHIIHYSQNSIYIAFKDEKIKALSNSMVDSDSLGDIHWVWTNEYAEYLKKFNDSIIFRAVGSITFRKLEITKKIPKNLVITIFDVAPQTKIEESSFYNSRTIIQFIDDVIKVRDENYFLHEYVIQLKPKRNLDKNVHSTNYIDHLADLNDRKKIKLLSWDDNPYSIISGSELIISIPFTSIAYIGIELGVQTIFYFPYQRQLLNSIYENIIPIVYGKSDLTKYLAKNLRDM